MGKFSANGTTKEEIRKLETSFAPRCLPLNSTDVIMWLWWPLHQKCQI